MNLPNSYSSKETNDPRSFVSLIMTVLHSLKYAILLLYYVFYRIINDYNYVSDDEIDTTFQEYEKLYGEKGRELAKLAINTHIEWWSDFYFLSQSAVALILCLFLLHDGNKFINKYHSKQKLVSGFGLAIVFFCSIYCAFEFYTELTGRYDRIMDSNLLIGMISGFILFLCASIFSEMTDNSAKHNRLIIMYRIRVYLKRFINGEKE